MANPRSQRGFCVLASPLRLIEIRERDRAPGALHTASAAGRLALLP